MLQVRIALLLFSFRWNLTIPWTLDIQAHLLRRCRLWTPPNGGSLKWWYPTTMGFPTKNDHFGVFWVYHHFRKPAKIPQKTNLGRCNSWMSIGISTLPVVNLIPAVDRWKRWIWRNWNSRRRPSWKLFFFTDSTMGKSPWNSPAFGDFLSLLFQPPNFSKSKWSLFLFLWWRVWNWVATKTWKSHLNVCAYWCSPPEI